MKTTMTVLFVIAVVVASTQTFRHLYVKWIESDISVLDEFKGEVDSDIELAKNIDDLVVLYREARQRVKEYEADEVNQEITYDDRRHKEPYKSARKIKKEIENREYDKSQLVKLKFYWSAGLVSLLFGVLVLRKFNAWLGFCGIVVGFSEMLCWTSPLFHYIVLSQQFSALLNYKLIFSLITLFFLIGLWLLMDGEKILEKGV